MCLECRVLGAVAHHAPGGGEELVGKFSGLDFRPHLHQIKDYLIDQQAEIYLAETLLTFKRECGIEFKVIKVDSDGSCLPYAVSRCLIGKEILYDVLREQLHRELAEHEAYYSAKFRGELGEEAWQAHFQEICEEALPTRGGRTGRWLGPGEHLVAMANVLARPILLLDELDSLTGAGKFTGQTCGMFLPSRLTRDQILERNQGKVGGPICIAWANADRNHFVSLIRANGEENLPEVFLNGLLSPTLALAVEQSCFLKQRRVVEMPLKVPTTQFVSLTDSESGLEIKVRVPAGLQPGDTFQAKFNRPPNALEQAWMKLLCCNPQTQRYRAIKTLEVIVTNLVDAFLMNNLAQMDKVTKLKLDNAMVKSNLTCAVGGLEFLLALGFAFQPSNQLLVVEFTGFSERTVLVRDALRMALSELGTIKDVQGEVSAGKEGGLFGAFPCSSSSSNSDQDQIWAQARLSYASDGTETSPKLSTINRQAQGVWQFGQQFSSIAQPKVDKFMQQVLGDFNALAVGAGMELVNWDDPVLYSARLMEVRCPDCDFAQEWTGPVDGLKSQLHVQACTRCDKALFAELTGARKLLEFVGTCSTESGVARCSQCHQLQRTNHCQCNLKKI